MITCKIDCSKIDKTKLFKGKKRPDGTAPLYLDLTLIETKQSSYGDYRDEQTHMIVQSTTKEERAAGVKGNILGNAIDRSRRRTNDQQPADPGAPQAPANPETDDVPF
jgi:hypothetical protein